MDLSLVKFLVEGSFLNPAMLRERKLDASPALYFLASYTPLPRP